MYHSELLVNCGILRNAGANDNVFLCRSSEPLYICEVEVVVWERKLNSI